MCMNSRIKKLKSLLGGEFLTQQPDSRQEKADILEMTVYFLRQQQQSHKKSSCSTEADEGYSRCVQEAINFLSQCQVHTQSQRRCSLPWRRTEVSFLSSALHPARSAAKRRLQAAVNSGDPGP
ncbi:transcription factor HES-5 [Ictalurus punctatus]|uniref:Transcription factor HES-5 n=1 Tax=Ictalurus punctatus TaxID=7998 RepID=A0A9F7RRI1_ICTPU|nr:transcription factor HES-5 [Ictalurus punctatus]